MKELQTKDKLVRRNGRRMTHLFIEKQDFRKAKIGSTFRSMVLKSIHFSVFTMGVDSQSMTLLTEEEGKCSPQLACGAAPGPGPSSAPEGRSRRLLPRPASAAPPEPLRSIPERWHLTLVHLLLKTKETNASGLSVGS